MDFKCKSCGSAKIKKCADYYECEYCGAKFTKDKSHAEITADAVEQVARSVGEVGNSVGKVLPFILVPIFVVIIVAGIIAFVNAGKTVGNVAGNRVFEQTLFHGSVPDGFSAPYTYSITGNLTNRTDKVLENVVVEVKYQIGNEPSETKVTEGITIAAKGIYTYEERIQSNVWGGLKVISVIARVDGEEYIIESW